MDSTNREALPEWSRLGKPPTNAEKVRRNLEGARDRLHKSLNGLRCPYCRRRGVYSELQFRPETMDNICPTCQETLIAE